MTIKKILLLVGMALATVALMAPAAQAGVWYDDSSEEEIGGATGNEYAFTGAISSYKSPIENGACDVEVGVDLWNEDGVPTGEVTWLAVPETPCTPVRAGAVTKGTILPGCVIEHVTTKPESYPWHIDVETGPTGVAITGANFANIYGAGCVAFGIPAGVPIPAHGTATGTWVNGGNGGCIVFDHDGDMTNNNNEPVLLNGIVCAQGPTLK